MEFFLIYHKTDKTYAEKIVKWFNEPVGSWKGMKEYIKFNFYFDIKNSIEFTNLNDPIPEIRSQLPGIAKSSNTRYFCIYITPYAKNVPDSKKQNIYYQVKFELLKRSIACQAIKKQTIESTSLEYSLRNIGIAIVAKLKGVPWRLKCEIKNELIVGVGAFKSHSTKGKYIGSAFCFSNDGHFNGFNCYSKDSSFMLAGSIREAFEDFYEKNKDIKRLIIHFYKRMSFKDYTQIVSVLRFSAR